MYFVVDEFYNSGYDDDEVVNIYVEDFFDWFDCMGDVKRMVDVFV